MADEAAAEGEEGFVDLVAAVVADEQALEVMQPGEGALDDPADAPQPQLDDRCRRRSSSGNGSLHFDSSSKRICPRTLS